MSDAPKKMVVGSMVVAGIIAVASISDLILGFPFSGGEGAEHTRLMDILFIVCSGILGYLAYDAYKDLR